MASRLQKNVWRFELPYVNTYLVADDVLTLVDAGLPWQRSRIEEEIRSAGFEPAAVKRVLVTHFDLDHVGVLASLPGAPEIVAGDPDRQFIAGHNSPGFAGLKATTQQLFTGLLTPPREMPTAIQDGKTVGSFTAIHTPGHTPGHMAYASKSIGIAFVGDLVIHRGSGFSRPPWFLNHDGSRIDRSLARLLDRMDGIDCVAPGHGDPICEDGRRALERVPDNAKRKAGLD